MQIKISDTFNKELPADPITANTRRQVENACFSFVTPRIPSNPTLLHVTEDLAKDLGFTQDDITSADFLNTMTGKSVVPNTNPYAMCYGGHQFGNWAGQLGDGRAINLFEVENEGKRWVLQLKGAGETPYSRTADGLAVLRSSIREHLCSEAMYHLGVPTTRSLSLALSGDQVLRDMLYNGNSAYEKGAIVCRVSPSFIRFGSFQIFASRRDAESMQQLVDYTIKHFYPEIDLKSPSRVIDLYNAVLDRTLEMIVDWQRVGFVHGVMNTDNMSILGLTIDYGPYGWLEGYDKSWTPNTTDHQNKRYRFGQQPSIALWNLYQLANALFILTEDSKPFEQAIERYKKEYSIKYLQMMRSKLGLVQQLDNDPSLLSKLETILELAETDMTIFYRLLSTVIKTDTSDQALGKIQKAFYDPTEIKDDIQVQWQDWFTAYLQRLKQEPQSDTDRIEQMNLVNPKYVFRNYMAQLAIEAADTGDYSLITEFYTLLRAPYSEQPASEKWFAKRPEWARNKVGCSMLSCSS